MSGWIAIRIYIKRKGGFIPSNRPIKNIIYYIPIITNKLWLLLSDLGCRAVNCHQYLYIREKEVAIPPIDLLQSFNALIR